MAKLIDFVLGGVIIYGLYKVFGESETKTQPQILNDLKAQYPWLTGVLSGQPAGVNQATWTSLNTQYPWLANMLTTPTTPTTTIPTGTGTNTGTPVSNYYTANCRNAVLQKFTSLATADRCTVSALQYACNQFANGTLTVDGVYGGGTKSFLTSLGINTDLNTITLANIKDLGRTAYQANITTYNPIPTQPLAKLYYYWLQNF